MDAVPMSVVRIRQDDLALVERHRRPTETWAECLHRLIGSRPTYGEQAMPDVHRVLEAAAGTPLRRCVIISRSGWSGTTVDRALRMLDAVQTRHGWRLPEAL